MLPLAIGSGPGSEERRAVAIGVIGGQSMALLLTLLVTPVAYSFFDDFGQLVKRWRGRGPSGGGGGKGETEPEREGDDEDELATRTPRPVEVLEPVGAARTGLAH
jgi:hydrophobic/amphiphilic exporter-1 (mainly G- bacteria), HAE1 family